MTSSCGLGAARLGRNATVIRRRNSWSGVGDYVELRGPLVVAGVRLSKCCVLVRQKPVWIDDAHRAAPFLDRPFPFPLL